MNTKSVFLVVAQLILLYLVIRPVSTLLTVGSASAVFGLLVITMGGVLILWAAISLRRKNLSVLPEPVTGGKLVEDGPYRLIRHPMYTALIIIGLGAATIHGSLLHFIYLVLLVAILLLKIHREEMLLRSAYEEYENYMKRSKKLVPFVF